MNKKTTGFTMIIAVIVILGLLYFTNLAGGGTNANQTNAVKKETEKLLSYDFTNSYPKTVRDVIKLHCRYLKESYNGNFTEEDLFTVNKHMRRMFADELLEINSESKQLQALKEDIADYKDNKKRILNYLPAEASQIEYNESEGKEYAKIAVVLKLRQSTTITVNEEYILVKDSEGLWKILGWGIDQNANETTDTSN